MSIKETAPSIPAESGPGAKSTSRKDKDKESSTQKQVEDSKSGFVKVPRTFLNEEWAKKPQVLSMYIRLLLMANRESKKWNGIVVARGQIITSYSSLSKSCGITIWAVRAALKELQSSGLARFSARISARSQTDESARISARGYTLVTICNYDDYDGFSEAGRTLFRTVEENETARSSARESATTKEYIYKDIYIAEEVSLPSEPPKTSKESKNKIDVSSVITNSDFRAIVEEWLEYKKERGESYKGKRGLTQFYKRLQELSGGSVVTARRIVETAMANNWAGIFPDRSSQSSIPRQRTRIDLSVDASGNYESTI